MSQALAAAIRQREVAVANARLELAEAEAEVQTMRREVEAATERFVDEQRALETLQLGGADAPTMAGRVVHRRSLSAARTALGEEEAALSRLEARLARVVEDANARRGALQRAIVDLKAAEARGERLERERRRRDERRDEDASDDATLRRWRSKK